MRDSKAPLLVGFVGGISSGKDTAANFLINLLLEKSGDIDKQSSNFALGFAFADVLKNIVDETFGLDRMSSDSIKRLTSIKPFNGKNLREVYQDFGETIKDYFGEDVWVNQTMTKLKDTQSTLNSKLLLCSDVRYDYEGAALRKFADDNGMDCVLIRMNNLNRPQRNDHQSLKDLHKSERLSNIRTDYNIDARSTDEIKEKIEVIINEIKG